MKTTRKKRILAAIVSAVVLVSVVTVLPMVSGATITVPDDYPTIQQAVNAANAGDIVYVRSGTYYEHVVIDKSLILQGETRDTTIVNGSGSGYVIHLRADNVLIQGLTVTNGNRGIFLDYADNCEIDDVLANYCAEGMTFVHSTYNTVANTVAAHNNPLGINIGDRGSHHNTFQNIEAYSNTDYGIVGYAGSHYTKILDSHLYDNGRGVTIGWSSYWSIENTVIHSHIHHGVLIDTASYGTVKNCEIYMSNEGIMFGGWGPYSNTIVGNRIYSNAKGLWFYCQARYNTVKENVIYNNDYGVRIERNNTAPNYSNVLYHNDFINTINTYILEDRYTNTWDNGYPSGGNYWSDYTGVDTYSGAGQNIPGSDSIGDTPYVINASNRDNYPFMNSTAPLATNTAVSPNPTNCAPAAVVTATIDDSTTGNSSIQQAEYFIDAIGANGTGKPMSAQDGAFDSPTEDVEALIDVTALLPGSHTVYIHGQDTTGSWGTLQPVSFGVHCSTDAEHTPQTGKQLVKQMLPLAQYYISKAQEHSIEAHDLLSQAQKEGLDTSVCEAILAEADNLLTIAQHYFRGGNYIAANIYALQALQAYQDGIQSLKNLLS